MRYTVAGSPAAGPNLTRFDGGGTTGTRYQMNGTKR
jgi:hypothetical protein